MTSCRSLRHRSPVVRAVRACALRASASTSEQLLTRHCTALGECRGVPRGVPLRGGPHWARTWHHRSLCCPPSRCRTRTARW